jgi:hypothetical protein
VKLFDTSEFVEDSFLCCECDTNSQPSIEFIDPNGDMLVIFLECLKKAVLLASTAIQPAPRSDS